MIELLICWCVIAFIVFPVNAALLFELDFSDVYFEKNIRLILTIIGWLCFFTICLPISLIFLLICAIWMLFE